MNTIARFVTRPSKPGDNECKPDIFIGACMKEQTSLKPNAVYEIRECLGEFILTEVGKSCVEDKAWGWDISDVMRDYGNEIVLTEDETGEDEP